MGTCTTRSSRAAAPRLAFACVAIAAAAPAAAEPEEDSEAALAERLQAAPVIVEGIAGRPYAAWDGHDPSSIRTYTPMSVARVLKGEVANRYILLRQPGGEVGGARQVGAVGASFEEGEFAIVLVGPRDPVDGSYDIPGRLEGVYRVSRDASDAAGVNVRLGADAGAYSSKEKAPGTLLARIPLGRFERLATAGDEHAPAAAGASVPTAWTGTRPLPAVRNPVTSPDPRGLIALGAVLAAGLIVLWRSVRAR